MSKSNADVVLLGSDALGGGHAASYEICKPWRMRRDEPKLAPHLGVV